MYEIIDVLGKIDNFEWFGRSPSSDAKGTDLNYPPTVVWRYKKRNTLLISRIKKTIESFKGKVEWQFYEYGRNMVLIPKRLNEITEDRKLLGNKEAARLLMEEDPEFGQLANNDLKELAKFIYNEIVV